MTKWGSWFGSFATAGAAKGYLTRTWTGPTVPDGQQWVGEVRQGAGGRWEVRLGEPVAVPFRQFTAGCPICEAAASAGGLPFINHGNCTAPGSVGHKPADQGHCTASACY